MHVWHLTPDAPRSPHRVSPGQRVVLHIGTWPIEPGQSAWVTYRVEHPDGTAKDTSPPTQKGSYIHPWVRLHAIRDYYSMAALVAEHPGLHLTINLTPSLLWQIEDYVERGATDRVLELTLKPAEALTDEEREQVLCTFFDAHWHNQIFPHPRYKELFIQRRESRPFTDQDLRDLQMRFNLAWFGSEFRDGDVRLATGEITREQT